MLRTPSSFRVTLISSALASVIGLAACGSSSEAVFPDRRPGDNSSAPTYSNEKRDTLFGEGGLILGGKKEEAGGPAGIGVNAYLWRATVDTVSFLPIASADPFGGVILTDWYSPPETPGERFKLNILILDRALRADGVKISVFRQTKDSTGGWVDAAADAKMGADLENTILTRARQLRQQATAK